MSTDASGPNSNQAGVVLADIGGTNIRFALLGGTEQPLAQVKTFRCADFAGPVAAIRAFLESLAPGTLALTALCLAVPGQVHQDPVNLVNSPWQLSRKELEATFSCPVLLLNDFSAQALSLPLLTDTDLHWLRRPKTRATAMTRAVLGPGTGLGVAALLPDLNVVDSEAGHMSFAPVTDLQLRLLPLLRDKFLRVSYERLLSGPGLENLYQALAQLNDTDAQLSAEEISTGAARGDALCLQTVNEFGRILGAVSGDLALAFGALGGVYLSGGLMVALAPLLNNAELLLEFDHKGRYRDYCRSIPVAIVEHAYPGLLGAAHYARLHLPGASAS